MAEEIEEFEKMSYARSILVWSLVTSIGYLLLFLIYGVIPHEPTSVLGLIVIVYFVGLLFSAICHGGLYCWDDLFKEEETRLSKILSVVIILLLGFGFTLIAVAIRWIVYNTKFGRMLVKYVKEF